MRVQGVLHRRQTMSCFLDEEVKVVRCYLSHYHLMVDLFDLRCYHLMVDLVYRYYLR